ncbi:hypothetical protein SDC9_139032 [bioreactor metagenome]|uniref:Uncharacterized protein n=1 Tax=bioreactor metagenome TaxID=1076179 RepID=A0A645DRZ8_9ZZZZ
MFSADDIKSSELIIHANPNEGEKALLDFSGNFTEFT